MSEDFKDWERVAFDVYRRTWTALDVLRESERDDLEFWIEELKEALLDLKQATIENDSARVWRHVDEIILLMVELRFRAEG